MDCQGANRPNNNKNNNNDNNKENEKKYSLATVHIHSPGGRQAYKIHYLSRSILQRIHLHKDTRKNCICNLGCRLLRFDMAKKNKGAESNEQVLLAKTTEYLNSSSVLVTNVACSVGVLFGRVNSQKRTIVYLT